MKRVFILSILTFTLSAQLGWAQIPQTMNYQGFLTDASSAPVADGDHSLGFGIYNVETGGTALWSETHASVPVNEGIFSVVLGSVNPLNIPFDAQYWLEVEVNGAVVSPRIPLASSPYSLNARSVADGAVTEGKIAGSAVTSGKIDNSAVTTNHILNGTIAAEDVGFSYAGSTAPGGPATDLLSSGAVDTTDIHDDAVIGDKIADGQVVRSVNARTDNVTLAAGTNMSIGESGNTLTFSASFDGWGLAGNADTNPATNFLGTTDNKTLELRVNNLRVMRLTPHITSPNIIAGYYGNWYESGVCGATISGGGQYAGTNRVTDLYGVVGGGTHNQAGNGEGTLNDAEYATTGGGVGNTAGGSRSTVSGGSSNAAEGICATIPGGGNNAAAGDYSFAAGRRARANHHGSFVWGDNTDEDIASSVEDQFLARSKGGVQFRVGTGALRLEPAESTPNIIAGCNGNYVTSGIHGATISGGGSDSAPGDVNRVTDHYGTIGGGVANRAGDSDGFLTDAIYPTIGGGYGNTASGMYSTIGGGEGNEVYGSHSAIGGGYGNDVNEDYSTIGGGRDNDADENYSTIGGGQNNDADGDWATIGGGRNNQVSASYGTISGGGSPNTGDGNRVTDNYGTVGGGGDNQAGDGGATDAPYATVSGGERNDALGSHSTIGGGLGNDADSYSTVGGGEGNEADGTHCTIGGGRSNDADADYATVAGGHDNTASASYATIAGGGRSNPGDSNTGNRATDNYSTVGGGGNNQAGDDDLDPEDARYTTVSGGEGNNASGRHCTIGGGRTNAASGNDTTVAGGYDNTADGHYSCVGGGGLNESISYYSTVPGGYANEANMWCSFAAGMRAKADHTGAFVWADSSNLYDGFDFNSTANNEFAVRCTGGARFVSGIHATMGHPTAGVKLAPGANAWTTLSDRGAKANFSPVDTRHVLERLKSIPIETWNYKSQDPSVRHMGPMAQDFYAAFGLGGDDKHISTIDPDGVALAAIQGLYELLKERDAQIADLEARLAALEAMVK